MGCPSGLPFVVSVIVSLLRRLTSTAAVARLLVVVLMTVFAVPAFGGACCGGLESDEVAEVDGENADGCCQNHGDANNEQAPCSCPFPCSSGCAGYLGRVLVQANALALAAPAPLLAVLLGPELVEPSNPEPSDILHVPKRHGA